MKILRLTIILVFTLFLIISFLVHQFRPTIDIFQVLKVLTIGRSDLNLVEMFTLSHQNHKLEVKEQNQGFVLIGPYYTLVPGEWEVRYQLVPDCHDKVIGEIDAVRKLGTVIDGSQTIVGLKQGEKQTNSLIFESDFGKDYEFRFKTSGNCQFEIQKGILVKKDIYWKTILNRLWFRLIRLS